VKLVPAPVRIDVPTAQDAGDDPAAKTSLYVVTPLAPSLNPDQFTVTRDSPAVAVAVPFVGAVVSSVRALTVGEYGDASFPLTARKR
jgi:hypothetical protein